MSEIVTWPETKTAMREEIESLRTRLESVEAARRDAQESRFGLIVENEELGAELAATRACLESAEKERDAVRDALERLVDFVENPSYDAGAAVAEAYVALGAAGENEGQSDG